jgi:hypothetical protein
MLAPALQRQSELLTAHLHGDFPEHAGTQGQVICRTLQGGERSGAELRWLLDGPDKVCESSSSLIPCTP